jgi:hypothetical protein
LESPLSEQEVSGASQESNEQLEDNGVVGRRFAGVNRQVILLAAVGIVAIAGWAAFVAASSGLSADLHAAESREQLQRAGNATLQANLSKMEESRDLFKTQVSEMEDSASSIAAREAAVVAREEAITAQETQIRASTLVDGTTYTVGATMEPGVYKADSTSSRCYWVITKSGTNYGDIVDNDLGAVGALQVTVGSGQDFQSHDCGSWAKIG